MTDAEIIACWQKHDARRQAEGRKPDLSPLGSGDRTAIEDTAAQLQLPYSRVRDVVLARLTGFGG